MARRGPSSRLKLVVASLIALTSMLGAIAAWRASVASSEAGDADRKGFADTVARAQERATISGSLDEAFSRYVRSTSYATQAETLGEEARKLSGADAARLESASKAYSLLADNVRDGIGPDELRPDGSLALDRAFAIEWESASGTRDLEPGPDFAAAANLRGKAERLIGLTALFIAAALFLTFAQVSRTRAHLVYFVSGASVLLTATALLAVVEVS
jgi:hypothetical protein